MNKRTGNKALSLVLALSMVFAVFYCDFFSIESKAATSDPGRIQLIAGAYNLFPVTEGGNCTFDLSFNAAQNVNVITYLGLADDGVTVVEKTENIPVGGLIKVNSNTVTLEQSGNTTVDIANYGTLNILGTNTGEITNGGNMNIYGIVRGARLTIQGDTYFSSASVCGVDKVEGGGTINATSFVFKAADSFNGIINAANVTLTKGSVSGAAINATDSLTLTGFSSGGSYGPGIYVSDSTIINSDGATFSLYLGENLYRIEGEVITNRTAGWVTKTEPTISAFMTESPLYGTDYDVTTYVVTDSDGGMSVKYAKKLDDGSYSSTSVTKPTAAGVYRAYITVAETDTYRSIDDWAFDYSLIYLTTSEAPTMGASVITTPKVSDGTYDYYDGSVTIEGNSGFQVSKDNVTFMNRTTVSGDGYYNGCKGNFRRTSDGAISNPDGKLVTDQFYIDTAAPEVIQTSAVDQDGEALPAAVADGAEFHARSIEFDIRDIWNKAGSPEPTYENPIQSVTVNGEGVDIDGNRSHVTLSTPRGTKSFDVVAKDKLGHTLSFTVSLEYKKKVPTATMTMADSFFGATLSSPVINTDSDQEEENYVYYYKAKDAEDTEYTTEQPVEPGDYTVKAEIPFTDHYSTTTCTADFSIVSLAAPDEAYTLSGTRGKNNYFTSDVLVNAPQGFEITDSADGTFKSAISYRDDLSKIYLRRVSDGARTAGITFSEKLLIDKVKPAVSLTGKDQKGTEIELFDGAEIHAKKFSFSVTDDNLATVFVNGELAEVSDGQADITVSVYDEKKAFTVVATDKAGNQKEISFTVENFKTVAKATVSVKDTYFGVPIIPTFTTNSDAEVKYYYKKNGTMDDFTTTVPSEVGSYTVQARLESTEEYTAVIAEDTFSIKFLTAPDEPYVTGGTEGKNGYYVTDVIFTAPEGFVISDSSDGTYGDSVVYYEGLSRIYLKRIEDGAKTGCISIPSDIKIDKLTPVFEDSTGRVKNGESLFADQVTINALDLNLVSLTLNGKKIDVTEGLNSIVLDPENGIKKFKLVAEDIAGNTATLEVTLMAEWLKDRVIPAGLLLPLEPGTYNLDNGKWVVSGDSTVYNGGVSIYVDENGNYTFTRVN